MKKPLSSEPSAVGLSLLCALVRVRACLWLVWGGKIIKTSSSFQKRVK